MTDIAVFACTLMITIVMIVYFVSRKVIQKSQSSVFLTIMVNLAITVFVDIVSNYIEHMGNVTGPLFAIQYATQLIFFITHSMLPAQFAMYVVLVNGAGINRKTSFYLPIIPLAITELFVITNPFTGFIFRYNEFHDYVRGPLIWIPYLSAAFYMIVSTIFIIRYKKAISRTTYLMLWFYFGLSLLGVIIQALIMELKVELFFESISVLGVLLTIENEDDFMDPTTKVYNRKAFVRDNVRLIETNHKYAVVAVTLTNVRLFVRILGYDTVSKAVSQIVTFLRSTGGNCITYRTSTGHFAVIYMYDDESEVDEAARKIEEKFKDGWILDNLRLDFNVVIRVARVPEDLDSSALLLDLVEETVEVEESGVTVMTGDKIGYFARRALIEKELKEAVALDGFEVYYQPIWNTDTKTFDCCEALVRLKESELGYIGPDDFISIAERCGLIESIGYFVFEQVCILLSRPDVLSSSLQRVDINLSLYQLLVGDVPAKFKEIVHKYGVDPKRIILEITETAQLNGNVTINNAIADLREIGFEFSLDDYGTGYSNLTYVHDMNFRSIKTDKSLLKSDVASKIILSDSIRMMRTLGMDVIQEGVETEEQLELAVKYGANYIQGFYFSRPLPEEKFVRFLEKNKPEK